MKQTAVEWLAEKLRVEFGFLFSNNILEQAKEIEKQQIIDAAKWMPKPFDEMEFLDELAEQYYNETYKG